MEQVLRDPRAYTALPIAAARALETSRHDAVVSDPVAQKLLAGLGESRLETPASTLDHMTKRALVGDELVQEAYGRGVRQVVILGAGMDARAFRMGLFGTAFFEVDRKELFEVKEPLVADVPLQCESRRIVPGHLGIIDMAAELERVGFDKLKPSVWLLEGLVMYLGRDDMKRLAFEMGQLAAPGSSLWHDAFSETSIRQGMSYYGVAFESGFDDYDELWQSSGFDTAEVLLSEGVVVDRKEKAVRRNLRFQVNEVQLRGRCAMLFVRAWKTS
eukprot:CAMPEP_0177223762 /NCGR_PEP_ID=MMETSP0367-20130122/38658_1 /TAXON_ID=447022 ORGANISM="Scrippsiella hangoei-like, Strain SHHI-4" /NCGR_SAMPLE_ID=MMETSP0367 /ASSEMBLY_ACC=CAM_ASM_000362 /LENGTH=272 /DNA_ID=CAMNT_0018673755 /DNA_START=110 /DNA_END=928 /DNA_ORIENTATION=-